MNKNKTLFLFYQLFIFMFFLCNPIFSIGITKQIVIEWDHGKPKGCIEVTNGRLDNLIIKKGKGRIQGNHFVFSTDGPARIEVTVSEAQLKLGPGASLMHVKTEQNPFTFFIRDVNTTFPIFIPEFLVVVSLADDLRSFQEITSDIESKNLRCKAEQYDFEPEETYENAAAHTRNQFVPTWLGLSRDIRIFQVEQLLSDNYGEMNSITPKWATTNVPLKQKKGQNGISYGFLFGRGQGTTLDIERKLEEGTLPILHTVLKDEDVTYHSIAFTSFEQSSLIEANLKGTHYLVADNYCHGTTFTQQQQEAFSKIHHQDMAHDEEVVLYFRCEALNTAPVPRYAFYKTPKPSKNWADHFPYKFDPSTGFSTYSSDSIFCVSKLNGTLLPNEEVAVLLQPGEKAVFEYFLPHQPIPFDRAKRLFNQSFDERLAGCKAFWGNKQQEATGVHLPERRINEMLYAGLHHLDLITYGLEPDGVLAPSIGVYSPIGTESAPIIQYYLSMGVFNRARRSLQYFLDKQHDDGMIQNFGGYMIETGAVLWLMGEYYRYTHDVEWLKSSMPNLKKACDFLVKWRQQSLIDSLRGRGYGMIAGKVADPKDEYHQYMLNGYAYLGMSRAAEIAEIVDLNYGRQIQKVADSWKQDIRNSFFNSRAHSPVVPLGDGRWSPTVPPWTETVSPTFLYTQPGNFFSHGSFFTRDGLLGPLHLVYTEVLSPHEEAAKMMQDYYNELLFQRNTGFSQPYYHRHDWMELQNGQVKPFLKTYYNTFAGISDRETYSFWEHYYHVSSHKTHEEAWFLMQTRWMLYMEEGKTLKLLQGIPRNWMNNGQCIKLKNAASYFGLFNLDVNSSVKSNTIEATIECNSDRPPDRIQIRLPHPEGLRAKSVSGGTYDANTETVTIDSFNGYANVKLVF